MVDEVSMMIMSCRFKVNATYLVAVGGSNGMVFVFYFVISKKVKNFFNKTSSKGRTCRHAPH